MREASIGAASVFKATFMDSDFVQPSLVLADKARSGFGAWSGIGNATFPARKIFGKRPKAFGCGRFEAAQGFLLQAIGKDGNQNLTAEFGVGWFAKKPQPKFLKRLSAHFGQLIELLLEIGLQPFPPGYCQEALRQ